MARPNHPILWHAQPPNPTARPSPPILRHAQPPPILRQLAVAIGFCLFLPLKSFRKIQPKTQSYGTPKPPNPTARPEGRILRQLAVAIGFCLFLPLKSFRKYSPKPNPMARPNPPILWHAQPPNPTARPNPPILRHAQPPQSYGTPKPPNPTARPTPPILWHAQPPQSYGVHETQSHKAVRQPVPAQQSSVSQGMPEPTSAHPDTVKTIKFSPSGRRPQHCQPYLSNLPHTIYPIHDKQSARYIPSFLLN